jgi:hypothetical protein
MFSVLRFDIKDSINPESVIGSFMSRIDITQQDGSIIAVITKEGEQHLLERSPKLYRAAGLSPFGGTELGRQLGPFVPFGSSPLATRILEGNFRHEDKAISAIAAQFQRRTGIPPMPPPTVTEQDFSKAFGGIRETSASSPSGLYNSLYKFLA